MHRYRIEYSRYNHPRSACAHTYQYPDMNDKCILHLWCLPKQKISLPQPTFLLVFTRTSAGEHTTHHAAAWDAIGHEEHAAARVQRNAERIVESRGVAAICSTLIPPHTFTDPQITTKLFTNAHTHSLFQTTKKRIATNT